MTKSTSSLIHATLSLALTLSACTAGTPDTDGAALEDGFHTGWIPGPNGDYMQVRYELSNGVALLDGDIILHNVKSEKPAKFQRAAMIHNLSWPGAVVPYEIGAGFNSVRKGQLAAAMKDWSDNTPFVFVERTTENDYVRFVTSDQCFSSIGRVGGMQEILVGVDCGAPQTAHEIGHAVGFFHEQSRQDRDDFINIDFTNVLEAKRGNFDKYLATNGTDFGPYEPESLMHYPALIGDATFVADTTKVTITKKDGSTYSTSEVLTGLDRAAAFRRAETDDPIKDKWLALGNNLGFALNSPLLMSDGTGRYLPLEYGRIYHHLPNNRAYAVYGAILARYLEMGGESNIGGPLTDETGTSDGVGRYNRFVSGSIYWSPDSGAHILTGPILAKYLDMTAELSLLGYPTAEEKFSSDGGGSQRFQRGWLVRSPGGTVTVKVDATVTGPPTIPGHPLCHFLLEGC